MFGECGPSASDLVWRLGGFLVHECDLSHENKYLGLHLVNLDLSQLVCFLFFFLALGFP